MIKTALICCVFFALNALAQDKMVFALDIIRHGDRTPTAELARSHPALWPEGLGQLTAQGKSQEYELGLRMRAFYRKSGLLPGFSQPGTVSAFSTAIDRTRASARLFLKGLLANPAATIPIQTNFPIDINAPISETNAISAGSILIPTDRPDYKALLSKYVFTSPEWLATNAALRPRFDSWSRIAGEQITTVHDVIRLGDTLYIHQIHHLPPPVGLAPDEVQAIIDAERWDLVYQYGTELGRITGQPLQNKITQYLTNAMAEIISGKKPAIKYVLISAHDSTLMSELGALQSPLTGTNAPPYAACLHFALFETPQTNFYTQIIYHDQKDHLVPSPPLLHNPNPNLNPNRPR